MANKDNKQQIVINQIITRPVNRQVVDIGKWRTALRSADMGRVQQLYDLYEDILLDGVLADAIDKRIRAVTGADVTFQDDNGEESVEMIAFIDTQEFETLLIEIMQSLFWGRSLIELTFDADKGMSVYSIPKKHIRPDTKKISIQENDPEGSIDYAELPNMIEVLNRKDKFGVILRACPYAIFKRGGFSDWAQMVEIFGMPRRVGKYSIYDVEARKQLQEAFDSQGAAATLIVPKETDVETEAGGATVSGNLYKDFISTCDEQLLITVLSQTMTTMDGSSRSQSETHKEVEEALNKHDLRFVQRILNQKVKPILEARGYPVKGGSFVFPKALEQLTIDQLISLSNILEIPAYYIQERFGIPQASDGDILAKRKSPEPKPQEPEPNEPDKGKKKEEKLTDTERGWFMNLFDFFAYAPTTWSGADRKKKPLTNRSFTAKLTDSITGKLTLADNYSIDIKSLLNQALNEVYNNGKSGKEQPVVSKPLFDISNEALQQAVDSAFTPDFGKKNQDFVDEFKHNTAVFAAFKNHHQTKDMVALLTDENGNLRSFREFKKLALSVSKNYNENWLRTEYNTAVRSARAAVNYRKYLESEELYPNLEYIQSTASHPRISHLDYVGTILPIRHEWWDTHMPPSDWNCSCSVRPTDKDPTAVPEGEYVSPVFQNNPGKSAEFVKLKEHPYIKKLCPNFKGCSANTDIQLSDSGDKDICKEICEWLKLQNLTWNEKIALDRKRVNKILKEWAKTVDRTVKSENLETGVLKMSYDSISRYTGHGRNSEEKLIITTLADNVYRLKNPKFTSLGETKDLSNPVDRKNVIAKRNRGVTGYNVYMYEYEGKYWAIGLEVINKGQYEQPYFIKPFKGKKT